MGISIYANNRKCPKDFIDIGYIGFAYLRDYIGGMLIGEPYRKWKKTNEKTPKDELDKICYHLYFNAGTALYNFLTQSDCKGELSYRECKEVLLKIEHMDNHDLCFGEIGNLRSFDDFKKLLQYCYSHRTKLIWR